MKYAVEMGIPSFIKTGLMDGGYIDRMEIA
jgi:hypothetical protein